MKKNILFIFFILIFGRLKAGTLRDILNLFEINSITVKVNKWNTKFLFSAYINQYKTSYKHLERLSSEDIFGDSYKKYFVEKESLSLLSSDDYESKSIKKIFENNFSSWKEYILSKKQVTITYQQNTDEKTSIKFVFSDKNLSAYSSKSIYQKENSDDNADILLFCIEDFFSCLNNKNFFDECINFFASRTIRDCRNEIDSALYGSEIYFKKSIEILKDLSNYDSYKQLESMNQDGDILLKQWFGGFYGKYFITIPLFFIFTNEFDIKNALEKDTYLISKNNFFIIRPGCEKIKTNKEESIMLQEIEKNVFSKELTPLINVFETESYLFEFFKKKDYESLVLKLFCPVIEPFGKITGQVLLTRKKNSTDTKSFQKFFDYDSNDDFKEYLNVSKKFVESLETFNELKKKFPKLLEIIKEAVTVEILCVDHKKKNFIKRFFTFPNNQLNKTRTITALSFLALTWFSRGTIKKILKLN